MQAWCKAESWGFRETSFKMISHTGHILSSFDSALPKDWFWRYLVLHVLRLNDESALLFDGRFIAPSLLYRLYWKSWQVVVLFITLKQKKKSWIRKINQRHHPARLNFPAWHGTLAWTTIFSGSDFIPCAIHLDTAVTPMRPAHHCVFPHTWCTHHQTFDWTDRSGANGLKVINYITSC